MKHLLSQHISIFEDLAVRREKEYFFANLSMLLEAGMTLLDALEALVSETKVNAMKKILGDLSEDIENGLSLSQALTKNKITSLHVAALVKIGEDSGRLVDTLKMIALSEEKNRAFKTKLRGAMLYPFFVFMVTLVVGVVVVWFILPKLSTVFAQMNVALPLMTRGLIALGAFLGAYGVIVIPGFFLVLFGMCYFLFYFHKTKHLGARLLFGLPGIGRVLREIELSRMGHVLGTLLQAGVPVVAALESLVEGTTSLEYRAYYTKLKESVIEGNSFARTFTNIKDTQTYIPITTERLIISGEQSGKLAETFMKISTYYEAKMENTTKNLSVIFEPVLLVIVWLGVVIVAMSVILPIYSLIGGFNS